MANMKDKRGNPLPQGTSQKGKLARAIGLGVCLGLCIVLVVGFLMPLSDLPPDDQAKLDSETANASGRSDASLSRNVQPTLRLPTGTETKETNVSELQDELKQLATKVTEEYPNDAASFHIAAQIYFELKQFESAEQLWKRCVELNPNYMGPYVGLATLLIEKGRNEDAIEILLRAENLGGASPEILLKLGEAFENSGSLEKALERLTQGSEAYPDNGDIWFSLGRVQNQSNMPSEAEVSLKRSLEIGGEREPVLFALNASLMRQKKTDESVGVRERIAKLKKPKQQDTDTFQDRYDSALARIAADVFVSAATLSESNGNLDEANRLYLRSIDLFPKNIEAYNGLLYVARKQDRLGDQRLLLSKLIELSPDNLLNYVNLASVAMQIGDAPLAERTLKAAVELDPNGLLAQAASAKLYLGLRSFTKARAFALQVVERQPSPAAYRLLAATYEAEGMEEKFLAAIRKADELEQTSFSPNGPR